MQTQRFLHTWFRPLIFIATILCSSVLLAAEGSGAGTTTVKVAGNALRLPVGRIALVRQGERYCAVKVTDATTDPRGRGYVASYVAYFQEDGSTGFNIDHSERLTGEISDLQPVSIIGRLASARGDTNIYCGSIVIPTSGYQGSAWLYFGRDKDLLIAPTMAKDFSELSSNEEKLQWYGYDEQRHPFELP